MKYTLADMEIVDLRVEDVILTSGCTDDDLPPCEWVA